MKMLAVMRYRRLAHIWYTGQISADKAINEVDVPVIPVLKLPEGGYANDSTVLIDILEQRHQGRSLNPVDNGDAFLAFLLEDFAKVKSSIWSPIFIFMYLSSRLF